LSALLKRWKKKCILRGITILKVFAGADAEVVDRIDLVVFG
jgi:hypothetical protein